MSLNITSQMKRGGDFTDSDIPKETTPSAIDESGSKSAAGIRALAPSRRMMISLVVFLVLVYVVYKMVAPSSQQSASTEIAAVTTPAAPTKSATMQPPKIQQSAPIAQQTQTPSSVPMPPPVAAQVPVQQAMPAQPPVMAVPTTPPAVPPQQNLSSSGMAQGEIILPVGQQPPTQPVAQAPIVQTQQVAQPTTITQPTGSPPPPQQLASQPPISQPPLMQQAGPQPVQPPQAMPPPPVAQQTMMQSTVTQPASVAMEAPATPPPAVQAGLNPMANDSKIVALQSDSAKLMSQLQTDYTQKLNDFSSQNKALQEEIQTLNSRISAMEAQINQLVQALTQTHQGQTNPIPSPSEPPIQEQVPEQKISYNVQAIIPGRAWLRSDNGETLTVAEGDVIKSLGRVVKIDPYDGVVEINTGKKVVSISYGTAA